MHPEQNTYVPSELVAQHSSTPANVDGLPQLGTTEETAVTDGGNFIKRSRLILAVAFICLIAIASVVPALLYSILVNNGDDCMFFIYIVS